MIEHLEALLESAELVKIRINRGAPADAEALSRCVMTQTGATIVARQGRTLVVYRASRQRRSIVLPDAGPDTRGADSRGGT